MADVSRHDFTIHKRENWRQRLQLTTTPQKIASSTNASPIVLRVPQHQIPNGTKVLVFGHDTNKGANGNFVTANATGDTLELVGSTGTGTGTAMGFIALCVDASSHEILCEFKTDVEDEAAAATPTVEWVDQTRAQFDLVLDDSETGDLEGTYLYDLWLVDSTGNRDKWMRGDVVIADSVTS